jgi:hypothetical protein
MKLIAAIVVYLLMGVVLGWGMFLAVKGSWWLLIAGLIAYAVWFSKVGCLPKSHH